MIMLEDIHHFTNQALLFYLSGVVFFLWINQKYIDDYKQYNMKLIEIYFYNFVIGNL